MSQSFNLFDLVFITLSLVFILTAFFRGFVKEIFSIFNWALALIISWALTPYLARVFYIYSDSKVVIDVVIRLILFVTTFVFTAMSTRSLSKDLRKKIPKLFDRSLGIFFGIAKIMLIFGLVYSIAINVIIYATDSDSTSSAQKMPDWFLTSKSRSTVEFAGAIVNPIVEGIINSATKNFDRSLEGGEELDGKIQDIINDKIDGKLQEKLEEIEENQDLQDKLIKSLEEENNSGYNKKDIDKMNRLIEIVQ